MAGLIGTTLGKVALGLAAATAVVAVGAAAGPSDPGESPGPAATSTPPRTTVAKIVDGDTIDVDTGGRTERVRLLNIDTPESVDPARPVECLGVEASRFLASILPVGTPVRLEYDVERTDRYGRTLAGVYAGTTFVNGAVAAAGYGVPVTVGANHRFRPAVDAAFAEARTARVGLLDEGAECTLPARVAALRTQATQAAAAGAAPAGGRTVVDDATAIEAALAGTGLVALAVSADRAALQREVATIRASAAARLSTARAAAQAAATARASAQAAARGAQESAAARPSPAPTRRAAAVVPSSEPRRTSAPRTRSTPKTATTPTAPRATRRTQEPAPAATRRAAPRSTPKATAKPRTERTTPRRDTYTGCRAYGPGGTSIDSKGRRYTKIPC